MAKLRPIDTVQLQCIRFYVGKFLLREGFGITECGHVHMERFAGGCRAMLDEPIDIFGKDEWIFAK